MRHSGLFSTWIRGLSHQSVTVITDRLQAIG